MDTLCGHPVKSLRYMNASYMALHVVLLTESLATDGACKRFLFEVYCLYVAFQLAISYKHGANRAFNLRTKHLKQMNRIIMKGLEFSALITDFT